MTLSTGSGSRRVRGGSCIATVVVAAVASLASVASVASVAAAMPLPVAGTSGVPTGSPSRPPSPPRDVVFTEDHRFYASPWYDGAWQEMIPFGCTQAPYYPRDPSCPRAQPGRHHGIDMFMPCGTKVRSAVRGVVVPTPNLGGAYGRLGMVIRSGRYDYVLGHLRRWYVRPGERVRPGQLVAGSGKLAAPDGCHLHFEKRPAGAGYLAAVNPLRSLQRTVRRY
jgi:murein DD-endopeptidase MepM/ murein hydrolase activator NlpD